MALTIALGTSSELPSGARICTFDVTFDSSYPTGGETCDISAWFGGSPRLIGQGSDDGYVLQSDRGTAAALKILAYEAGADAAALDEVAATTDLSALVSTLTFIGTPAL